MVSFPPPLTVYSFRCLADISCLLFFLETSFQSRYHMAHSLTSSSLYQNRISLEGPLMTILFKNRHPHPYILKLLYFSSQYIYDHLWHHIIYIFVYSSSWLLTQRSWGQRSYLMDEEINTCWLGLTDKSEIIPKPGRRMTFAAFLKKQYTNI